MLTQFKNWDMNRLKNIVTANRRTLTVINFLANDIVLLKIVFEDDEREILYSYTLELPDELRASAWIGKTDKLVDFIRTSVAYKVFAGTETVAVIDTGLTCIKEFNMPVLNKQDLAEAIKWDAVQHLPYREHEYVYGYNSYKWDTEHGEGVKINLIATEKQLSSAVITVCSALKLKLSKMTVTALALGEMVQGRYIDFAILDIHADDAQVTMFEELRPVQNTTIGIGRARFIELIAEELAISKAQASALLREQSECQRMIADNPILAERLDELLYQLINQSSVAIETYLLDKPAQQIECILLAGSLQALTGTLRLYISNQLGIYADELQPLDNIYLADTAHISSQQGEFNAAIGAAMLTVNNSTFTMLPFSSAYRANYKLVKYLIAICCTIFIALLLYESLLLHTYKRDYQTVAAEQDKIAIWRKRSELINKLQTDTTKRELVVNKLQSEQTAWPQVLLAMGYSIPDGVSVISIAKIRDEDNYILRGKTEQVAYLKQFMSNLQKTNAFKSVTLQQVNEGLAINAHKEFTITLKGMGTSYVQDNQDMEQ